jgi:uncharacterized protein (DUF1810 family)
MTSVENDPYDLKRFVDAQNPVFKQVCEELKTGRKRGHWMWFIFPQLKGLGHSATSLKYGISGREEAAAYLRHPILGPRLEQCTQLINDVTGSSIHQILGSPDDQKFRSSMTLFASVTSGNAIFKEALRKYYDGEFDRVTLDRLQTESA